MTLMLDEIHLQPYFDYKRGTVTGAASNSTEAAKTAHFFMVQSLLSPYKDVVHILPVCTIDANTLHRFVRKLITELEEAGLFVVAVICDNNSINRKMMRLFSPHQDLNIVYPHPVDPSRPLFYVTDSVHILKCVRNNCLNQKNTGRCFFPDIQSIYDKVHVSGASFDVLCKLHASEEENLSKYAYGLTCKALQPSTLQRQNVKLAFKVFSIFVEEASKTRGVSMNLDYASSTAELIGIIRKWWSVVNVKTPKKGRRLNDDLQNPVSCMSDPQKEHFSSVVDWLDTWKIIQMDTGILTGETHSSAAYIICADRSHKVMFGGVEV